MPAIGSGSGKSAAGEKRAKRPRPKPKPVRRPSATQRARAQERSYGSQGRAVERVANEQRRTGRARAQERGYESQGRAVEKRGREQRLAALRSSRKRERQAALRRTGNVFTLGASGRKTGGKRRSTGATARLPVASVTSGVPFRAASGIGRAFYEAPGAVSKGTARGLKDMAVGAPGALAGFVYDTGTGLAHGDPLRGVKRTGKEYVKDVGRRYGPLVKGRDREFIERIKKEGAAGELADASILATGVGGAASRGVGAAARTGRLGEKARRTAAEPRRRERTSGGGSREQELSSGFFGAAKQKRRDEAALRGQQRHVRQADERAARREGGPKRGEVDAVVREATARGEVVPSKVAGIERRGGVKVGVRRAPSARKVHKAQRVAYARAKGRALHATRRQQRAEGVAGGGHGAGRLFAGLDRAEQRAYKTALQLNPKSVAAGKRAVEARIAQIEARRAAGDVDVPGLDELPVLRKIAADPGAHFTPKLRAIVAQERARGARLAEADPGLGDTPAERSALAEARRSAPQFSTLGVTRKATPIRDAETAARRDVRKKKAERSRAGRRVEVETRKAAREGGRAQLLRAQGEPTTAKHIERAERAVAIHTRAAANHRGRAKKARSEHTREAHTRLARAAEERAQKASERRDELVAPRRRSAPETAWFKPRPNARDPKHGRGIIDTDGRLHTWNEGEGTHAQMAAARGVKVYGSVSVAPDGTVTYAGAGGSGRGGPSATIARAVAQDPRLKPTDRMAADPLFQQALERAVARYDERHERPVPKRAIRAEERAQQAENRLETAKQRREVIRDEIKQARDRVRRLRGARRRGIREVDVEPLEEFLARGRHAAAAAELDDPAFFASAPRETVRRSLFTAGGFRSVPREKRYKGTLYAEGREDSSFTTYAQGLARNIKRQHNWNLVTDTVQEHAFEWGRNKSVEALRQEMERRGVDPDSVAFWSPGVFREARKAADEGPDAESAGRDAYGDLVEGEAQLREAVRLAQDVDRFESSRDWVAVPKEVLSEIEADTQPSGWFGRGLDVFKGKQARLLLGTSPAWLQFQIASNMLLTTMAGVGPLEIVRAQRWWNRLSDEERAAIEPYIGVGHFHDSLDQVRIGSAANGRILNGYRAFKAHPFWHKPRRATRGAAISQLNPLDALFRIDNAQNNAFRRAVLYNRVKRDAYARMGENVDTMQRLQDRLIGEVLGHGAAEDVMRGLIGDRALLERHAGAVRDFLGDYETYTARERRTLGRSVMFYGFLRFSLRFTFYTMPVKHPTMTAIIGQLGRMQTEEVRKLLGGDELPWAMGRFFYTSDGKLKSINVARANPFLNTLTELNPTAGVLGQTRNLLRFLPPVYVALANQAFAKSSFKDRPFRVKGETQGRRSADYGEGNRLRIFGNELARLVAIYRAADVAAGGGAPQGDDSILGDRPTEYVRADIVTGIDESRRKFRERGGARGSILRDMVPFIPEEDESPEIAEKMRVAQGKTEPGAAVDYSDPVQRREAIARAKQAAKQAVRMSPEERAAAIARAKAAP